MTGDNILDEAKTIINGSRNTEYGTPEDSFSRIAEHWESYLAHTGRQVILDPCDVAMMMTLMKIARIESGSYTEDSIRDAIGYLTIYHSMLKSNES